jgi:hypothetical protein
MNFEIYNRYHHLHENLVCPEIKHSYLHIPVNSSCWGKTTFHNFGFIKDKKNLIDPDHTIVVFLRDPIDRWLSGLSTWLTARVPQHTPLYQVRDNWALLDVLFNVVHLDEHTQRQQFFLQNLNLDQMKFFMVNDSLSISVTDYLNKKFNKKIQPAPTENATTLEGGKLIPKQYFKQVLESNSKYLEHIKLCFEDDYKFIKSLTFENYTDKKFQYYD